MQDIKAVLIYRFFDMLREHTLGMQERGRRVLQIFRKIFRNPGDHRPKYFIAQ